MIIVLLIFKQLSVSQLIPQKSDVKCPWLIFLFLLSKYEKLFRSGSGWLNI